MASLGLILVVNILFSMPAAGLADSPSRPPQASTSNSPNPQTAQQNSSNGDKASQPPQVTPPATNTDQKTPPPAKPQRHKKKPLRVNCSTAEGPGNPSPSATGASTAATPPENCPPEKKIVPQGGTSDPNIQLAGGPGGQQASQQRATASQMLGAAEQNLKTISGRQLTSSQQDMVAQIRQFMDQSKAASTAGELERARTLAWKAQMLSEELAKPAQ